MRRLLALAFAFASLAFIGCAQGTSDGPSGNKPDAHVGSNTPDAFVGSNTPDAFVGNQPDAFVQPPADANVSTPDAPVTSGFCTTDNDCDVANGQCCFQLGGSGVCIPLDSAGLCLPF